MSTSGLFDDLKRNLMADANAATTELQVPDDASPALSIRVDGVPVTLMPMQADESQAMLCADCGEIPDAEGTAIMRVALDVSLALYRDVGATLCTNPISGHLLMLERVPLQEATAQDVLKRARRLAAGVNRYAKDHFGVAARAGADGLFPGM